MTSSVSDQAQLTRIHAALAAGDAEQPHLEAAYVAARLPHRVDDTEDVLAQLTAGVSPYQVFGEYPMPGTTLSLEVTAAVMPPGAVTPAVITAIRHVCASSRPRMVLDIGCGTGVLGIAAMLTDPCMEGVFVDIDLDAAACADRNLSRLGFAHRATAICADAATISAAGTADLIVANPPFVPDGLIAQLPARFRDHAPALAVRGGSDGLDVLRQIAPAMAVARPGCLLVLQIGDGQKNAAADALAPHWTPLPGTPHEHPNVLVAARRQ